MRKYRLVADQLLEEITHGKYKDELRLPIEEDLITEYSVSRNTLRNAVDVLVDKSILYRVQGSGIYIRKPIYPDTITINSIRGFKEEFKNKKIQSKMIKLEQLKADEEISRSLQCEIGTPVYFVNRIRYVENEPFSIEYSYFNKNIIPYLGKEIAEASIYNYIEHDLKLSIGFADKYIYVEKLSKLDSEYLQLKEEDPSMVTEETVFLSNGKVFNHSKVIHNYKYAKFFALAKNW
ncbi:GntR family transcriptional regulator [Carnobacterium funditum]|uniref:GntR family transcriptional regulator n=1 Tax=Carnobacterium funditum TaxID=2752 RepID=UPI0005583192|nr:GntR family transcriptional regulator [Carnobacterium funditum]